MSSLFDDAMMGAKVASTLLKGVKKFGKIAADNIQKVNESEKFQNLKSDIQNRISNSETLSNVKSEVQQKINQFRGESQRKTCPACGGSIEANARFCSACGAAQEEFAAEEDFVTVDPECVESLPTVLQNTEENVPDIFDFEPK